MIKIMIASSFSAIFCFVTNMLNNKTIIIVLLLLLLLLLLLNIIIVIIILLSLVDCHLILTNSVYGLIG